MCQWNVHGWTCVVWFEDIAMAHPKVFRGLGWKGHQPKKSNLPTFPNDINHPRSSMVFRGLGWKVHQPKTQTSPGSKRHGPIPGNGRSFAATSDFFLDLHVLFVAWTKAIRPKAPKATLLQTLPCQFFLAFQVWFWVPALVMPRQDGTHPAALAFGPVRRRDAFGARGAACVLPMFWARVMCWFCLFCLFV